ncbi:DUF6142 family protein [Anaerosporobacter faecicola]|uniref:DUF6142 family protein n=1 Tax=Anaerosporobacter faecicola TaxID=2718714 RepID=UPI00143B0066|nr:DUF6142 family protein [Anaerosporobacter faecicola]
MRKRKKQDDFKFSDKYHPIQGIIGTAIGGLVILCMLSLFIISSRSGGNAGLWIGLAGMGSFLLCIAGFIFSVIGFRKQEIYYRFPITGIMMNSSLFVVFLLLYIVGI